MCWKLCAFEHAIDGGNGVAEISDFSAKLFASGGRERVIAGAPIVLGAAPLGADPAIHQQPLERGVERTFFHLENLARELLNTLSDAIAVHPPRGESFEDQHVERAWEKF